MYLYVTLIFVFCCIKSSETKLLLPTMQQPPIMHCAVKILKLTFAPNLIVLHNGNYKMDALFKLSKSTTIVNLSTTVTVQTEDMFEYYIFSIQEASDFQQYIKKYYYTPSWNPRAKFLILLHGLEDNIQRILDISWEYYAINLYVLHVNSTDANVYTYFPFQNGSCNNTRRELLVNCGEDMTEWFPNKVPQRSNGCAVTIGVKSLQPFIIDSSVSGDNARTAGLEIVLVNTLFKAANLTAKYLTHFIHWGIKNTDGTATLLYKMLLDRNCDVGIGHISKNESFYYDFDGTFQYIFDSFNWYIAAAKPIPQWKNLFMVFDSMLWSMVGLIFFINALVWWVVSRGLRESSLYNHLSWSLVNTWSILLQISVSNPRRRPMKVLYIFWTITTFLVAISYQSKLVSFLTTPLYEEQISNVRELVVSGVPFGSFPNTRVIFSDVEDKEYRMIYKRFIPCYNEPECMTWVYHGNFSYMRAHMVMQYKLDHWNQSYGNRKVYEFKEMIRFTYYSMYTARGYLFLDRFNEVILRLQASGLVYKWIKNSFNPNVEDEEPLQPLKLSHLTTIFMILIIGWLLGMMCLVVEQLYHKYTKRVPVINMFRK